MAKTTDDKAEANRGAYPSKGSGGVTGSGAGAGGGAPEDYDSDPQSGGGTIKFVTRKRRETGSDR
jgi:hypothetical protein